MSKARISERDLGLPLVNSSGSDPARPGLNSCPPGGPQNVPENLPASTVALRDCSRRGTHGPPYALPRAADRVGERSHGLTSVDLRPAAACDSTQPEPRPMSDPGERLAAYRRTGSEQRGQAPSSAGCPSGDAINKLSSRPTIPASTIAPVQIGSDQ